MSTSLKAAEVTVRVVVVVLQLLAVAGGITLIVVFHRQADEDFDGSDESAGLTTVNAVGGVTIGVASLIFIYEIIMITLVFVKHVNHPARLLVDIILNSMMAVLTILATLGVTVIAILLAIVVGFLIGSIVFAIFAVPFGFGIFYSIAFIVSAITAGIIRSKLVHEARASNPTPAIGTAQPSTVFVMVPQQGVPQRPDSGYYPPPYSAGGSMPPSGAEGYASGYPTASFGVQPQYASHHQSLEKL